MDFEYHYTEEQERFREEVRTWLTANTLPETARNTGPGDLDLVTWERCLSFRKGLGEMGWLMPASPADWDGRGLNLDNHVVLREELRKVGLEWLLDNGASSLQVALNREGSSEQQKSQLSTITYGEANLWHLSIEPGVELDTGNLGVRAFLDGDEYVLTGEDAFVGQGPSPDLLWVLTLTDPHAPSDLATATFLVPAGLEGIHVLSDVTLVPGGTRRVTFDKVWVPSYCLLGDEGEGWDIVREALQAEPVAEYPPAEDEDVVDLIRYAREEVLDGIEWNRRVYLRQLLMEVYVNSQVIRVLRTRNAWLAGAGQRLTYQEAEVARLEKRYALRLAQVVRDVLGVYALLDERDPRAPLHGRFERQQRKSVAQQNPTGGSEVQSGAIARHLGMGRRKTEIETARGRETPTGVS